MTASQSADTANLARLEPARRYQILAATAVELLIGRIDDVLGLFDAAVSAIDGNARRAHEARIAANSEVAAETVFAEQGLTRMAQLAQEPLSAIDGS